MRPDLSEFSYGYALTEDLIRWGGTPLTAAPVFPSLLKEGKAGGGWDVRLPFQGVPLFLQFKLSDYMISRQTTECKQGLLQPPFYRMHLRPLRYSQQHRMLLDLESAGVASANTLVFYVAPAFRTTTELNDAYVSGEVVKRSVFFRPSAIGSLPDGKDHHVAFQVAASPLLGATAYRLSHPVNLAATTSDLLAEEISARLDGHGLRLDYQLADLAARMSHVLQSYVDWIEQGEMGRLNELPPLNKVAYLARVYFGCEIFIVRHRDA